MQSKICTKCGSEKTLDEFAIKKNGKYGRQSICKSCLNAHAKLKNAMPETKAQRAQYHNDYYFNKGGKEVRHAYGQTDKRREQRVAYERSEKGIEARERRELRRKSLGTDKEKNLRYRSEFPLKKKAHGILNRAIGSGILHKAECCECCGMHKQLDGHHDDYSMPLHVRWLCRECHTAWHRDNGPGLNGG